MNLFTELNQESEKQKQQAQQSDNTNMKSKPRRLPKGIKPKTKSSGKQGGVSVEGMINTQNPTYLRKPLRKGLRTEAIEAFSFGIRKRRKVRVTADIPVEWRKMLDDFAHELQVGKYELVAYIIADFLGKTDGEEGVGQNNDKKQN